VKLIAVNAQPSGHLPREPEPRPRSALQLASIIGHVSADAGFLLNSDASRVSVVTETGEPGTEEYTFALIADQVLAKQAGTVVANCCTSRMIDDIAAYRESPLVRCAVGQASVLSALDDELGVLGGEGNGSIALPAFSRAFDGLLGIGLMLEAMAESGQPLSALIRRLPRYHMVKRRIPCEARQAYRAMESFKNRLVAEHGERVDMTDGLRVDWPDGWVHLRASRTEQVMRVIAEATSREAAERRADEMVRALDEII
jgi:phosphomannomutase